MFQKNRGSCVLENAALIFAGGLGLIKGLIRPLEGGFQAVAAVDGAGANGKTAVHQAALLIHHLLGAPEIPKMELQIVLILQISAHGLRELLQLPINFVFAGVMMEQSGAMPVSSSKEPALQSAR